MSLSESASDKKRVLELDDEGHDGGCTRSGPGPIRKLYEVCCRTLDVIIHHYVKRTDVPVQNTIDIRCIYGRLVRFDDVPLHLGNLDDSLKSDKDLRDDVINRLRCLGHTLRRGLELFFIEQHIRDIRDKQVLESLWWDVGVRGDDLVPGSDGTKKDDEILAALERYTSSLEEIRLVILERLEDLRRNGKEEGRQPKKIKIEPF